MISGEFIPLPRGGALVRAQDGSIISNPVEGDAVAARNAVYMAENAQKDQSRQNMFDLGMKKIDAQIAASSTPKDKLTVTLNAINDPNTPPDVKAALMNSIGGQKELPPALADYVPRRMASAALNNEKGSDGKPYTPADAIAEYNQVSGKSPLTSIKAPLQYDPATRTFK